MRMIEFSIQTSFFSAWYHRESTSCMKACLSKSSITADKEAVCKAMFCPCINLHSDASFKSIGTLQYVKTYIKYRCTFCSKQSIIVLPLEEKNKFVLDVKEPIHTFVIFFFISMLSLLNKYLVPRPVTHRASQTFKWQQGEAN